MSEDRLRSYSFATEAQWKSCLLVQTDPSGLGRKALRPFPLYAQPAVGYPTSGAYAPVGASSGEILWRDASGALYRLSPFDDAPEISDAPSAISQADRIVFTPSGLWVKADSSQSVHKYEAESLSRLAAVAVPNTPVIDIARDGQDSVLALVETNEGYRATRIDRAGHLKEDIDFIGISEILAFVFLRRTERFVILAGRAHPRLCWFNAEGRALFSLPVAAFRPCFGQPVLASDTRDRVFLGGVDGDTFGGDAHVVILDADGNLLADVPLEEAATGIASTRDSLLVTTQRALLRFKFSDSVPEGAGEARCTVLTPMLFSPDREDKRRWLRVEALATLPEGTTLELSWFATDKTEVRDRLKAVSADESLPASLRVQKMLQDPDVRNGRTEFPGTSDVTRQDKESTFSGKLFDVSERYLWVVVTLTASMGSHLPSLSELAVLYPGRTLMENLPAVYQKEEESPNNFLRALVGVLEATTQGIDARIASMGSRIHPSTAPETWMDFIARWLGVPWDDGLSVAQKQRILQRAPDIAKGRGTRAGLEALIESLIPGKPRRFRVTDTTADFGFAIVGGDFCTGSALPAMLGGFTRWASELDTRAVLGYMRLPCPGQREDGAWQLAGRVRVEVAATAEERAAWMPWLQSLLEEMIPLDARIDLRWVTAHALRTHRLDDTWTLDPPPTPHLGTDAVTCLAHLPEGRTRLSGAGPETGTRLR